MNKKFYVDNLGELEFVVTLIENDYPVSFVAQMVNSETSLFIFDEYDNDDTSVTWICARISIDDLDDLNRGLKTLNSCFLGPRNTKKEGYLITSRAGNERATCEPLNDLTKYVAENDVFVSQFVEDSHGSELLSLITKKNYASFVLDSKKYASGFLDFGEMKNKVENCRSLMNSLPFYITVKNNRTYISNSHSIVVNFEISDKKEKINKKQEKIKEIEDELANRESDAAIETLNLAFNSQNTNDFIGALKNNVASIDKFGNFIESFDNKKTSDQILQLVSPNKKTKQIIINREKIDSLSNFVKDAKEKMKDDKRKSFKTNDFGYFEKFDSKSEGKFRFISNINKGAIYRGVKSSSFNASEHPIEIKDPLCTYSVTFECFYYEINGKTTKISYSLIAAKKESKPIQSSLL